MSIINVKIRTKMLVVLLVWVQTYYADITWVGRSRIKSSNQINTLIASLTEFC